jgi:cell division septation protein DedD
MILPLLLVLLFTAGLSLGQSANNTSIAENNSTAVVSNASPENGTAMTGESETANETILQNATQPGNITNDENETAAAATNGLKFIWSVRGIEADQIIMVLDQDGTDLFGQAKYEPQSGNPWNGEVTGSVSGDKVDLTVTAQKDNELVSSKLSGTFDELNGTINGNFTQVNQGKIMNKGSFTAIQISPDTSSYTPATIEQPKAATAPAPAVAETTTPEATTTTPDQAASTTPPKSRFVDVHQYADKQGMGGDLSGVPPGMGGSGGL